MKNNASLLCRLGLHAWDNRNPTAIGEARTCQRPGCGRRERLEVDIWNAGVWVPHDDAADRPVTDPTDGG